MGVVFLIVIIIIAVWVLASCVRIVPQAYAVILERLGAYQSTWSVGFHIKIPVFDKVARKINLKEQVVDFAPQPVITKDNVTMRIDTVVFFQITDPNRMCVNAAKVQLFLVDALLSNNAVTAKEIIANYKPQYPSIKAYLDAIDALTLDKDAVRYDEKGNAIVDFQN